MLLTLQGATEEAAANNQAALFQSRANRATKAQYLAELARKEAAIAAALGSRRAVADPGAGVESTAFVEAPVAHRRLLGATESPPAKTKAAITTSVNIVSAVCYVFALWAGRQATRGR